MLGTEFFFKFSQRRDSPRLNVGQSALDTFEFLQFVHPIKQFLVGGSVLDYKLGFAIYRQNQRMTAVAHLAKKLVSLPLKVAQGVDVFADVNHASSCTKYTLNLMLRSGKLTGEQRISCTGLDNTILRLHNALRLKKSVEDAG